MYGGQSSKGFLAGLEAISPSAKTPNTRICLFVRKHFFSLLALRPHLSPEKNKETRTFSKTVSRIKIARMKIEHSNTNCLWYSVSILSTNETIASQDEVSTENALV